MMRKLTNYFAASAAIAMACSAAPAFAQAVDGEDSLAVGVEVQIAAGGATVTGLEDIAIQYDGTLGAGALYEDEQLFCVYSPTPFIHMTVTGATSGPTAGKFYVLDIDPVSESAKLLTYDLFFEETISGANVAIGPGPDGMVQNGVPVTGIDAGNFTSGETCSDGENVKLTLKMVFDGGGVANPNAAVVAQLVDGLVHNFSDIVTITVSPAI